ncbi:ZIP zinc transporter-domain-containing protein [Geopyxis carbonaria]|nr:ZIP zinc transporter-domain-containing protein [Geopyxis carbonaria]
MSLLRRLRFSIPLITACLCIAAVYATDSTKIIDPVIGSTLDLSTDEIDEKLQECPFVQQLNADRLTASPETSTMLKRVFAVLFPFGPALNSLLATAYISGPPNFLLALCPSNIDPNSLSTFMGEPHDERAHFVMHDTKRNELLGLFIFIGFATFVAMDKTLRIITAGSGDGHGHGHSHSHAAPTSPVDSASTSALATSPDSLKHRKNGSSLSSPIDKPLPPPPPPVAPTVKPSSILNLVSDFTHNITDGLAMSGAFYASPTVGATTCMAVMLHEIPHEVGDFALLIQGGFTKWQAMGAQFITAVGAFTGTLIGIAIQEWSKAEGAESAAIVKAGGKVDGLWGTDLKAGDLVLPFTAGTFLYVGFSVIPELLETGKNKGEEIRKTLVQGAAMALGFGLMFMISE